MCVIAVKCVTIVQYAYFCWWRYVAYNASTIGGLGNSVGSECLCRNCLNIVKTRSYTFMVVGAIDFCINWVRAGISS